VLSEGAASPDCRLPLALGRSLRRAAVVEDLAAMPHLLMVGADEAERRAGLRALLVGLLSETTPAAARLVAVDGATPPLPPFARLPHVALHPERHPDGHPEDHPQQHSGAKTPTPEQVLAACRQEMNVRYRLLDAAEASDHMAYNERVRSGDLRDGEGHRPLPLLVLVVARLGDLLAEPACESVLLRLTHGMPAVGMHLLVSAAAETLPRIPQALLSAIPHRIAYAMPSRVASRAALDCRGAEALTGAGDVLYRNRPVPMRLQSPVASAEAEAHALSVDCAPYTLPCLHPSHPFLSDSSS
jgi:S-DNA-T family DNA segregation ATPase FtsK/SpoIIIE